MYALQERKLELQELRAGETSNMQYLSRLIKEVTASVVDKNIMGKSVCLFTHLSICLGVCLFAVEFE